jgi:hypothetical protein
MTQEGFAFTWVKDQMKSRNGRQAYIQLKTALFGKSFKSKIKAAADAVINTASFTGYKNLTIDDFGTKLRNAYIDLQSNGEPMTDERKVRQFLSAIKDPKLEIAKGIILADDRLLNNFDYALNYTSEYASNLKSTQRNISMLGRGGGGHGRGGGRGGRGGRGGGGRGRGRGGGGRKTDYMPFSKWSKLTQEGEKKWKSLTACCMGFLKRLPHVPHRPYVSMPKDAVCLLESKSKTAADEVSSCVQVLSMRDAAREVR